MKKIFIYIAFFIILLMPGLATQALHYAGERNGYILLQAEDKGQAWYVYPGTGKRYYLGRPDDAFSIMKSLALGAKHDFIIKTDIYPDRLLGMILLDIEQNGEAYYIYPADKKKYYLARPADAFQVMRQLGQGISNQGLASIPVGEVMEKAAVIPKAEKVLLSVPFTSQAPFGDWRDSRQQNGCEEASVLMAVSWARGQTFSKNEALEKILSASKFLEEKYGEYRDSSSADTLNWLIKDYLGYSQAVLKEEITVEDIINELNQGNLVITAMNGQIMHNPYYTPPGPYEHMIVIRGYDPEKKSFITNDPGTRHGELFSYDAKVLYDAIRDYPTGYRELITNIEKKMIVVWK